MSKRIKKWAIIAGVIAAMVAVAAVYYYMQTWPLRFGGQLDSFFGTGSWQWISTQKKSSLMYSEYYSGRDGTLSKEHPGSFFEWGIQCGQSNEQWVISNHTMKINHDKYWFFSPKRYSAKQALVLELMDISMQIAQQRFCQEQLQAVLTKEQIDSLSVCISYRGGNPAPKFYTRLAKQPWFNTNDSTVGAYLQTDLYDFYLDIKVLDYRFDQLSQESQQALQNSLEKIEKILIDTYKDNADYKIFLGNGYSAERKE